MNGPPAENPDYAATEEGIFWNRPASDGAFAPVRLTRVRRVLAELGVAGALAAAKGNRGTAR